MQTSSTTSDYRVRTMTAAEVEIAVKWAALEGWNPGLHDAATYHTADPHGFLIGTLGDEPVATLSAIRYGRSFGFLGFYIVKPAYRGQGYGIRIWDAGMQYLEGRNIGLDGVVEQQDSYRKSGFDLAYRNIRFAGPGGGEAPGKPAIVDLRTVPFAEVQAYDLPFFPVERAGFLEAWIRQPESHALGVYQQGGLAGYGVIRRCRSGHKVAPLVADSPELAETLFLALRARALPAEPVFLDVPEVNQAAVEMAERYRMKPELETARMYTGQAPALPLDRIFGVTSFEIG